MNPNSKYFLLHPDNAEIMPLEESKKISNQLNIGASLVLRKIAKEEMLDVFLSEEFPDLYELIQTLVEYYLINRDSAAQLFKYYLFDNYSLLNYVPSDSQLSKFFNDKLDEESIKHFLNR